MKSQNDLKKVHNKISSLKVMFFSIGCCTLLGLASCMPDTQQDTAPQNAHHNELKNQNNQNLDAVSVPVTQPLVTENMAYQQRFYVPIYSDIYVSEQNPKILMSAALSIRNTSQTHALFINNIDYFNTEGELVRQLLTQPIKIVPMGTYNHNVEKKDDTGGVGANFLISTSAKQTMQPIIQAVMIGQYGNKAFAFSVDGVPISQH